MPDKILRKQLLKKSLERWENEGGRLSDEPRKTPEKGKPRKRGKRVQKVSSGLSAAGDKRPVRKSKPIKKLIPET